ncbi:TPA: DUF1131 family protein [Candidatus Poribacteria bacterium]|nr:DUF1131 family protein [Candidatus Poribacteria bacterium]HIO77850.1 DUF1131 family protein [Candidatus Poribacteria bacterium]
MSSGCRRAIRESHLLRTWIKAHYVCFAGKWHGPDGVLPPIEILRSWELSEIVWKP